MAQEKKDRRLRGLLPLRHRLVAYEGAVAEVKSALDGKRKLQRWVADLWYDLRRHAVNPESAIQLSFDDGTEWLSERDSARVVYFLRAFGCEIGGTGSAANEIDPMLMAVAYALVTLPSEELMPLFSAIVRHSSSARRERLAATKEQDDG